MDRICIISWDKLHKPETEYICGIPLLRTGALRTRRRIRRFIMHNRIDGAVMEGDTPDFAISELERASVPVFTGERLMEVLYPAFISRAAKLGKGIDTCTIYTTSVTHRTVEIIRCAAAHFRHVALCTDDDAEHPVRELMDSMGLTLKIGDSGGVGIICSGTHPKSLLTIDLTSACTATFADENRRIITPAIAEALAGENLDGDILTRLGLKINSLC